MSVITMVTDPATDKQIPKAKGTIKRINIKQINADGSPRITNITKGPNAGKTIKATHRYSILLEVGQDAVWISFGEGEVKNPKYADQFQIKVGDQYKNLLPGMEISVYPIEDRKWLKDGVEQSSWQGKKKNINLLDESGAQQPAQQGSSGGSSVPEGGTKIFGEVLSIENGVAQVKTENGLVGPVVLGSNTVTVGGRLAAIVDASGNILSGFKAYGPAGQGGAAAGSGGKSAGSFKKDNSGVETGHAINGALNLKRNGHQQEVLELAKIVHDTTVSLKASERARDENKGVSDYDIGAAVGHAVLNATRDVKPQDDLAEALTTYATGLLSRVVPEITAYVKAGGAEGIKAAEAEAAAKAKAEQEAAAASQQASQSVQQAVQQQAIDMTPPPLDFDDNIPFAPVGLQYARHAIYAI